MPEKLNIDPGPVQRLGGNKPVATPIAAALWLMGVIAGMVVLTNLSNTPSASEKAPNNWPIHTRILLDATRPTLLMFAHPHCPCTRASLSELELLLAQSQGQLSVHVLFLQPAGVDADWAKTDLWRRASASPGVTVHCDRAGGEARRFHSDTSGQTLLYDPEGHLMFEGGITIARGHSGDNPGRSAILALVRRELANQGTSPVFGCSLFEANDRKEGSQCKQ